MIFPSRNVMKSKVSISSDLFVGVAGSQVEGTLRACCQEHFGVGRSAIYGLGACTGPTRAAARRSDNDIRFGSWELGRSSVEHPKLFGQSCSASLHQPRDRALGAALGD